MSPASVVAVLSGGGAKGAAHLGVIKALEERGLGPARYVGTSMGAVIGAMAASGVGYDLGVQRIGELSRSDVAQLAAGALLGPLGRSLLKEEPLRQTIRRLVPARRFDDLAVPLTVTAVDAETGELVLFGAGGRSDVPLLEALYASAALPVYYPPAVIGGRAYLDGGLRAVLPLDVVRGEPAELVVASYTGPALAEPLKGRPGRYGMLAAHDIAVRILMAVQAEEALARWPAERPLLVIRPRLEAHATFRVAGAMRYVEEGYRAAVRALGEWAGKR